jgi:hypothetical protein
MEIVDCNVKKPAAVNIKTIFHYKNYVPQVREPDN